MKISKNIRILIVEDDPVQAQVLQDKLIAYNPDYNIVWFDSGEKILNFFKASSLLTRFNYVVLDYYLQTKDHADAINGFEVIEQLKQLAPKVNVILFSAFDADTDRQFDSIKEEPNVLDIVKKSEHSFSSIQNIIRFDYSKQELHIKKRRMQWFLLLFLMLSSSAFIYFLSTNYFM